MPSEVTNDLSCTGDDETQSLNANLPNGTAAGEAGPNAGELKVGGVTSQMINWVFTFFSRWFLFFLRGLKVLGCFARLQAATDRPPPPSDCDEDAEEGRVSYSKSSPAPPPRVQCHCRQFKRK